MNRNVKMLSALLALALSASFAWAQATPPPAAGPTTKPAVIPPAPPRTGGPGPGMGQMMMPPPATRPAPDELVFTLNGKKYTEGDVESTFRAISGPRAAGNDEMAMRMLQMQHAQIVDRMVTSALLDAEAEKLKITVTDADLDAQAEDMISNYTKRTGMTREQLSEQTKAQSGMTLDDTIKAMRPSLRLQALADKVAKEMFKDIQLTDEEIKQAYDRNPSYLPRVKACHILLGGANRQQPMTPEEKEAAHTKAIEALAKAKAPGADFAALAKEYSTDPGSKDKGGELPEFQPDGQIYGQRPGARMVPAFTKAAYALKPGETSDLVESEFGYHIIKLTATRPAKTLEEVRAEVTEELKASKRQSSMQNWLQETRAKADLQYAPGKAPATRPAMPPRPTTRPATGQVRPGPAMPLTPRPTTTRPAGTVPPPAGTAAPAGTVPPPAGAAAPGKAAAPSSAAPQK